VDLIALLDESVASTGKTVAGVRPDQLGDPTPCSEWNVRAVLNHVIGVATVFSHVDDGRPVNPPDPNADYFEGDAYVAAYDTATARMVAAWRKPGMLDATIKLPFGEFPGSVGAGINYVDTVVHGWDLARATGQDTTIPSHLAEPALEIARNMVSDEFRAAGAFGPEVAVAADAPAGDRLVAFLGRTP
jgi:uncharacterized protein (TIGR03086 family)